MTTHPSTLCVDTSHYTGEALVTDSHASDIGHWLGMTGRAVGDAGPYTFRSMSSGSSWGLTAGVVRSGAMGRDMQKYRVSSAM